MNRRQILSALAATAAAPALRGEAIGAHRLVLMTFNIRLDTPDDGPNRWPHRRGLVASVVRFHGVDLVGMQEVLATQKRDLVEDLPEFGFVGVGRDDGREAGEFSPILFRRERFELGASGTFWLSPTPDVPGSRGWDAAITRIASWARLRDRRSGRLLLVLCTHFDHKGETARTRSAELIVEWITKNAGADPVILLGDFNSAPTSDAYRTLSAPGALVDTQTLSELPHHGPSFTFQGFDYLQRSGETIDFAFLRNPAGLRVLRHGTLPDHRDGRYPSDHFPVLVELT